MKKTNFTNRVSALNRLILGMFLSVLALGLQAQTATYNGSTSNNEAGTSSIPSTGTGGCPSTATFNATVSCVGNLGTQAASVQSVQINLTHTWDGDLDIYLQSPTGQVLELSTGNGGSADNYTNTVFRDNGATFITAGAAPFTGTFKPEGRQNVASCNPSNAGTVGTFTLANTFNAGSADGTWQLRFFDNAAGDSGSLLSWSITFAGVTPQVCTVATPAAVTVGTGANAVACAANAVLTVPGTSGACQGLNLSYNVDGGAFISLGGTPPATVTIPGLSVGVHTIRWRAVNACNQTTVSLQQVTVVDNTPPTFPNCPVNTTFNLAPGDCNVIVNYDADAADNCGSSPVSFTQNASLAVGDAIDCFGVAVSHLRVFDLAAEFGITQPLQINSVNMGVFQSGGSPAVTIKLYTLNGALSYANMTLIGQNTVNLPALNQTLFNFPVSGLVPANSTLVVEIITPGTTAFIAGYTSTAPATGASYLYSVPCGVPTITDAANFGFVQQVIMQVVGQINDPFAQPENQTAGLPSGSSFPIGTTVNTWTATDGAGNTASCNFSITVNEYPNAIDELICNDDVQVSLDQDCIVALGADQILEGGPYGCYDNYIVQIKRGNVWSPGVLGAADVNHSYQVRVTDPSTGNSCWGNVHVEDKLPPVITCSDLSINCNASTAPVFTPVAVGSGSAVNSPTGVTIASNSANTVTVPLTVNLPANAVITDVNVPLNISHTWVGDLNISLTSPSGTTVQILSAGGGCGTLNDINATFDDEGNFIACSATPPAIAGNVIPFQALSAFDGQSPNGNWTLTVQDVAAGDGGPINSFGLNISYFLSAPYAPAVTDNCSTPVPTYVDQLIDLPCSTAGVANPSGRIIRTWTVTDPSGNSAGCTQTITLNRPSIQNVTWPHNYDNIDLPALACGTNVNTTPAATGKPQVFGVDIVNGSICDFTASYTDEVIDICAGTYKILRQWKVIDWCTSTVLEHNQIIKVLDQLAPVVTGIDNITVGTSFTSCSANVLLPSGTVSDNCSPNNLITVSITATAGTFSLTNPFLLLNVPLTVDGSTPVTATYTFTDNCGNVTTKTITITVIDDVKPIPVCDENTQVSLGSDGTAELFATSPDDGSHDNCGIDHFEIRRMPSDCNILGTPFQPSVTFTCCDITDTVIVVVRVYDLSGNFNDCMVQVYTDDKIPPICVAPSNLTINCDDGYNIWNLEQFGQPTFWDNCTYDTTYTRIWNLDNCHAGTITRRWKVTDHALPTHNQDQCQQTITVLHRSDFIVDFPEDVTFTNCDLGNAGVPVISDDDCELVAVNSTDQLFDIVPDACYKIIRTWTVVNWCIYNPNATNNTDGGIVLNAGQHRYRDNGDGYFRYVQIIKILDNVAPTITSSCADVTFEDFSGEDDVPGNSDVSESCDGYAHLVVTATDACSPLSALKYHWRIYPNGNLNATPIQGTGSDASGEYPYGCHLIKWEVEDGCGNVSYCEYHFTILDKKKPTITCINGLASELMWMDTNGDGQGDQGMVTIWDSEFLSSWDDNCTPTAQLKLRIRKSGTGTGAPTTKSVTYTCDDLGTNLVELWAGDNASAYCGGTDNWDYCETYVLIQDNMGVCGPNASVAGGVQTEEQEYVNQVTVKALATSNALPSGTDVTGNDGHYAIPGLQAGLPYTVSAEKNMDPLNGVTTYDLVLISKHILGVQPLNTPYKMIAADVNKSNTITAFDMVELRKLILHIYTDFPTNSSWRFVDKNYVFPNPTNPWSQDFPEVIDFANVSNGAEGNFTAVKVGDVNGSAQANNLMGNQERNAVGTLTFKVADATVKVGEEYTVDFKASDFNALGYQFTLNFNNEAVEFVGAKAGALNVTNENVGVFGNAITMSWNGDVDQLKGDQVLFSLTFKGKAEAQLSKVLSVSSRITPAEAYTKESELMDVAINFGQTVVSNNTFELYQNEPNPFKTTTVIGFTLPETSTGKLSIFDASGRVLKVYERTFVKGYNAITLNRGELSASGVLYYQLDTPTNTATKKMIIVE